MKKIILSFAILSLLATTSCNVPEGIDGDATVNAGTIGTQNGIFDISTDNTGTVRISPTGNGAVSYNVSFGDGSSSSATVLPGTSTTHIYSEGNYSVTIISTDVNGNQITNVYPLNVLFTAPTNINVTQNFAGTVLNLSATATNANGFTVNWGDGSAVQSMTGALGGAFTVPGHNYTPGVYTLTVVALSGGAATTTATFPVVVNAPFSLPITYDSPIQNYNIGGTFGDVNVSQVANPFPGGLNTSATVRKYNKLVGAPSWGGTWTPLSSPNGTPINIDNGNKIKVLVYATEVGKMLNVELEQGSGGVSNKILKVASTVANQWEELVFDFGTQGIPAGTTFNQLVFRYNDNSNGSGEVIYLDNITQSN